MTADSRGGSGRTLPQVNGQNSHFWTGGKRGELVLLRCSACSFWIHPAEPICPRCHHNQVMPAPTGGRGMVYTFTINHQQWQSTWSVPYLIAIVELDEQEGLRLTTNLDMPLEEVAIGLRVEVRFDHVEDVFLPYFVPLLT